MCAREASRTLDSSSPQIFRHLCNCLRSESSYCTSRHTRCSPHIALFVQASTYLYSLWCMRQSPIICTHAWPSCHIDLSTYNNLTLPHLGFSIFWVDSSAPLEVQIVRTDFWAVSDRPVCWCRHHQNGRYEPNGRIESSRNFIKTPVRVHIILWASTSATSIALEGEQLKEFSVKRKLWNWTGCAAQCVGRCVTHET